MDASLPDKVIGDGARIGEVLQGLLLVAGRISGDREVRLAVYPGRDHRPEIDITFEITPVAAPDAPPHEASAALGELSVEREVNTGFRRAAQALGGELGVHAQNGSAPVIWYRVPVQYDISDNSSRERPSSPGSQSAKFPVKILMAEDNSINQRVGKLILQRAGYAIDLVSDGNEALEAHRNNSYDLILMDCQMPTMDGFEATRHIRSISARQPVIIAVTANALVGERERCLAAGMDDYLSKPFQAEQLVLIVEKSANQESLRRL